MASVNETLKQINSALKASKNGPYSKYSCKTVSWDDVGRGTIGGGLSCWGSNITDTRLYAKDGRQLFTVRGDNWNERLGVVSSEGLALVASDDGIGAGSDDLRPFTLRSILSNIGAFGKYAGLDVSSLASDELDQKVSVRFQTTFLPVEDNGALEFAPEAYNYNTQSDKDPRNLVLLCTTQGLAIQQDGAGAKKLYHHARDDDTNRVHRYWLEAESSKHKVGGQQMETDDEKEDALRRGKATSSVIGVKSMGTRFNVLMTIQVPLAQKKKKQRHSTVVYEKASSDPVKEGTMIFEQQCAFFDDGCDGMEECFPCGDDIDYLYDDYDEEDDEDVAAAPPPSRARVIGSSSAARVSRGSRVDVWDGLDVEQPERHPTEHVTATIVMYYTCSCGVPSESDVKAAVDDLENLYKSFENGKLADDKFDFMKSELTVKDMVDIKTKLAKQPPPSKLNGVRDFDVFPSSSAGN